MKQWSRMQRLHTPAQTGQECMPTLTGVKRDVHRVDDLQVHETSSCLALSTLTDLGRDLHISGARPPPPAASTGVKDHSISETTAAVKHMPRMLATVRSEPQGQLCFQNPGGAHAM